MLNTATLEIMCMCYSVKSKDGEQVGTLFIILADIWGYHSQPHLQDSKVQYVFIDGKLPNQILLKPTLPIFVNGGAKWSITQGQKHKQLSIITSREASVGLSWV